MDASGLLRERDLRVLTAVVEDGLRDDPGEAMPWVVLERLQQLIPCQTVQLVELDLKRQTTLYAQVVHDGGERCFSADPLLPDPREWELLWEFLPCRYEFSAGGAATAIRWSDFYTNPELKNTPFYADCVRPYFRDEYSLQVTLPTLPGNTRTVALFRDSGADFTERDRLALQLLRPHLHDVYVDAERRRHGVPHLSPREREVLQLVAQGHSNADVARVLFISVATVRKHMEHIFDRTGVRTRSAAAALALPQVRPFSQPPRRTGR
jgi:DNA-binding CsgD family transcriptional regulator